MMFRKKYGIVYSSKPPYEVLQTNWLSFDEIIRLKQVEEVVEVYYNSMQFVRTMEFLLPFFENAFFMYECLGDYYEEKGLFELSHSRMARYEILLNFVQEKLKPERPEAQQEIIISCLKECLLYDLYLRENLKNRPQWADSQDRYKDDIRQFYKKEAVEKSYLKDYEKIEEKQLYRMTHLEVFHYDVQDSFEKKLLPVLFDYQNRSPLSHEARTFQVKELMEL